MAAPLLVTAAELFARDAIPLAGGQVSAHTAREPGKLSPNEDAFALLELDDQRGLIMLADGAGGMPAGAEASALVLSTVLESVRAQAADNGLRAPILDGIERANRLLLDQGQGAATTLEVIEIDQGRIRSYHIGDSDALLIGGRGRIKYQTVSHSPVGYAVESGLVDPAEALHHEDLHLVSNLVGTADMKIEIGPVIRLARRDTLLVASDGLSDNLAFAETIPIIRKGPLAQAREALAGQATARMAGQAESEPSKPDDLTIILFRPGT